MNHPRSAVKGSSRSATFMWWRLALGLRTARPGRRRLRCRFRPGRQSVAAQKGRNASRARNAADWAKAPARVLDAPSLVSIDGLDRGLNDQIVGARDLNPGASRSRTLRTRVQ